MPVSTSSIRALDEGGGGDRRPEDAPETCERLSDWPGRWATRLYRAGHAGLHREPRRPGFGTEALRIVGEGVADFATVDRILRDQVGFRLGPFELMDLTALDVSHR